MKKKCLKQSPINRVLEILVNFEYKNLKSNEISFTGCFDVIYAWCAKLKTKG